MGYLNEDGLARYDGLIKNWVTFKSGTVDGIDPLLNWQKTSTAGAVTFFPLPAAPIDPTVNFAFTETGPASGTKSPDNPSTITGVTQAKVTRCGKNFINLEGVLGFTRDGITFTVDSSAGTVTVSGTATATVTLYVSPWPKFKLYAGQQYFLSGCPSGGSVDTYYLGGAWYSEDGNYGGSMPSDTGSGALLSRDANWHYNCIIRVVSGTTVSNLVFKPQLELGSTATAFEPYDGTDYTVNLGGTFYGGSVDLSTGVMTVTHGAIDLNGDTDLNPGVIEEKTDVYITFITPNPARAKILSSVSQAACSILPIEIGSGTRNIPCVYFNDSASGIRVQISKSDLNVGDGASASTVVPAALSWLAAHPGVLVYPFATPYTVQLTPTQIYSLSQLDPYTPRLNTVYSDQQSVQVGYPKSPQATSTELTNAIIELNSI